MLSVQAILCGILFLFFFCVLTLSPMSHFRIQKCIATTAANNRTPIAHQSQNKRENKKSLDKLFQVRNLTGDVCRTKITWIFCVGSVGAVEMRRRFYGWVEIEAISTGQRYWAIISQMCAFATDERSAAS